MKRSLLWFALALSLLFNVFFAAGYLRARTELAGVASGEDDVAQLVARELDLDDRQRAVFADLRASLDEDTAVYGDSLTLIRQELAQELEREQPDLERLRTIVERESEFRRERRLAGARRFRDFVGVLNPEQRRRLSDRLGPGRRGGPRRPGPDLRKFDVNEDGRLDEAEWQAVHEHMEQNRVMREQRRRETLERYDTDGNGRLDEAERERMMLEKHDANGNGVLDPEERDAIRDRRHEGRGEGRGEGRRRGR